MIWVIQLGILDTVVITDIAPPVTVHSEKGRHFEMVNRPYFGLSLCINGQITYSMNGQKYVSDKTSAILLPQGGSYSLYGDKDGVFPVINFKCENLDCHTITLFPLKNPDVCIKHYENIKKLFLFNENKLKVYSIFYDLIDSISKEQLAKQNILYPAMKYLEKNIADPQLSNTQLARQAGISEVYLRKQFLTHYNTTPKQYILDVRIEKAKQMLIDTPYKITAVSESCGFSSVYHFCREFKKRTGLTATEFAMQNRLYKI